MGVAIIEIAGRAVPRQGTRRDGTSWGPFYSQTAYVHGQDTAYPRELEVSLRDANSAYQIGFYMLDGSALAMIQPQDGKGSARPGLRFDINALVPLGQAVKDAQDFMEAREAQQLAAQ
jgi:hypothetical protein